MYKSVIEFREWLPADELERLAAVADRAFDNRAGRVCNISSKPYCLSYEGGELDFACLELGMLALKRKKDFLTYVKVWNWIDEEEPEESCDLLELFTKRG